MDWEVEALRLARLARLEVSPERAVALARACEAITADFSDLAAYADALPPAPEPTHGALRADEPVPVTTSEVEGILAAAPRVDPVTRAVLAPRGRE